MSFAAAAGLAVVGAATIRKALRYDRRMLAFALFPAIFAFHQAVEGMVWLSLDGVVDGKPFRHLYILIAVLLWPALTPVAAALAETEPARRRLGQILVAAGLALAAYLAFKLARASGIEAMAVGHSLSYVIGYDARPPVAVDLAYAAVTIIPLVAARNRVVNAVGALVGASFLYTFVEMREVWFSVWCLSAAIFSALFYFAVKGPAARA